MSRKSRRLDRENETVDAMVHIYCRGVHGSDGDLCDACSDLLDYAKEHLDSCPFQAGKPTCAKCSVHCYSPEMRENIRTVMRYAGPRMPTRHPLLTLFHALDGLRKEPARSSPRAQPRGSEHTRVVSGAPPPSPSSPTGSVGAQSKDCVPSETAAHTLMKADLTHRVERWLEHVRRLAAGIGPRGSTTEGERRGAEYCQGVLTRLGLAVQVEPFAGARSIYVPHLIAALAMLLAFALYPLAGRPGAWTAAALSLAALASDLLELSFVPNPLRWLTPKGASQNVVATIPPAEEHRQDVVLVGHVDSHRTPLIFQTARWVSAYQAFTTVAFVLFVVQVVLYTLGAITRWNWIWPASIPSGVAAVLLAAMCLQADRTPFSAGANDNASGAGLVLALAEHLRDEPLRHTRVWLACTGCEEVQHYGAIDFFRRHRAEMLRPTTAVFETMGCAGPAWLTGEGIVVPFRADRALVDLAERLAAEHPEWGAFPSRITGGNTEMADARRVGIPAITLMGMTPDGEVPYWHQVEDTVDKMDPEVMARAYAFARTFVQRLDTGARRST